MPALPWDLARFCPLNAGGSYYRLGASQATAGLTLR